MIETFEIEPQNMSGKELFDKLIQEIEKFEKIFDKHDPELRDLLTLRNRISEVLEDEIDQSVDFMKFLLCQKADEKTTESIKTAITHLTRKSRQVGVVEPTDITEIIFRLSDYVRKFLRQDLKSKGLDDKASQLEFMGDLLDHEMELIEFVSEETQDLSLQIIERIQQLEGFRIDLRNAEKNQLNEKELKKLRKMITINARMIQTMAPEQQCDYRYANKMTLPSL